MASARASVHDGIDHVSFTFRSKEVVCPSGKWLSNSANSFACVHNLYILHAQFCTRELRNVHCLNNFQRNTLQDPQVKNLWNMVTYPRVPHFWSQISNIDERAGTDTHRHTQTHTHTHTHTHKTITVSLACVHACRGLMMHSNG